MPVLTAKARSLLWKKPQGFGLSHCMNCALSWTRDGDNGAALVICLLDHEPVLDAMKGCSRFEEQPDKNGGARARPSHSGGRPPQTPRKRAKKTREPLPPKPDAEKESPQEPEPEPV